MSVLPARRSVAVVAVLAAGAAMGATTAAHASTRSKLKTTTTTVVNTVTAPLGQLTSSVLSVPFSTSITGWSPINSTINWLGTVGHTAPGALSVTFGGAWTGASSSFPVVAGSRYLASGYASATTAGHQVLLALQFRDVTGAVISPATQIGQPITDAPSTWSSLPTVAGLAPAGAVTGSVLFVGYDTPAGETHLLDDVSVTQVSGAPTALAGPLHTTGAKIVDAKGRVVTLHGINISGLETYGSAATPVSPTEVATAQQWGANYVRIPLGENSVVPGDCSYDSTYLARVDAMVQAATSRGMLALVDLHRNALTACGPIVQQNMPDSKAVSFWQIVANRYKSNPLVAFDLYNEPHDITDSLWRNGGTTTSNGVTYTAVGMQTLYNTVRGTGATNLVFASGDNWASSYPSTAPITGATNLVYAVHAYTCPGATPAQGGTCNSGPTGIYDPSGILGNFLTVSAAVPVVITEFGWPDRNDGIYSTNVIAWATAHGWGWSVWGFDGTTYNNFDLVKDTGPYNEPTVTGMAVIAGMTTD